MSFAIWPSLEPTRDHSVPTRPTRLRARQLAGKCVMARAVHYFDRRTTRVRTKLFGGERGRFRIGSRRAKICAEIRGGPRMAPQRFRAATTVRGVGQAEALRLLFFRCDGQKDQTPGDGTTHARQSDQQRSRINIHRSTRFSKHFLNSNRRWMNAR
jgi:hypothetical protein